MEREGVMGEVLFLLTTVYRCWLSLLAFFDTFVHQWNTCLGCTTLVISSANKTTKRSHWIRESFDSKRIGQVMAETYCLREQRVCMVLPPAFNLGARVNRVEQPESPRDTDVSFIDSESCLFFTQFNTQKIDSFDVYICRICDRHEWNIFKTLPVSN